MSEKKEEKKGIVHPAWSRDEAFFLGIVVGLMLSVCLQLTYKFITMYPWTPWINP